MNQKERMLAGLPYKAWLDGLPEDRLENKKKLYAYNSLSPEEENKMDGLIRLIRAPEIQAMNMEYPLPLEIKYGSAEIQSSIQV